MLADDQDPAEHIEPGGETVIDLLVPEGLGKRTDIRTVGTATAFPAPGVTQALQRTELIPIAVAGGVCRVPSLNLLEAIVAKATAADVDNQDVERHFSDVVFPAGLVADPIEIRKGVQPTDRRRLKRLLEMLPEDHPAWNASTDAHSTVLLLVD